MANTTSTTTKKRTLTPEQKARNAARLRKYRAEHPDRCKRYRETYILRAAQRLLEAEAAERGGGNE